MDVSHASHMQPAALQRGMEEMYRWSRLVYVYRVGRACATMLVWKCRCRCRDVVGLMGIDRVSLSCSSCNVNVNVHNVLLCM